MIKTSYTFGGNPIVLSENPQKSLCFWENSYAICKSELPLGIGPRSDPLVTCMCILKTDTQQTLFHRDTSKKFLRKLLGRKRMDPILTRPDSYKIAPECDPGRFRIVDPKIDPPLLCKRGLNGKTTLVPLFLFLVARYKIIIRLSLYFSVYATFTFTSAFLDDSVQVLPLCFRINRRQSFL